MPLLVLARHAFTPSALESGTADVDRPLDDTGREQARRMGEFLRENAGEIDTVIASAARRTVQTAEAAAARLDLPIGAVRADPALYDCGPEEWAEAVLTIPEQAAGALIVGHQPTLSQVVSAASGLSPAPKLRPSSIAVFELDEWQPLDLSAHAPFGELILVRDFI